MDLCQRLLIAQGVKLGSDRGQLPIIYQPLRPAAGTKWTKALSRCKAGLACCVDKSRNPWIIGCGSAEGTGLKAGAVHCSAARG